MNVSDVIVIGAGPAGYRTAEWAAKYGRSVTIFEPAHVGGTCLNEGCIPTKAFARNAELMQMFKQAEQLAVNHLDFSFDFQQVVRRKNEVVDNLRNGVQTILDQPNINLVKAKPVFKTPEVLVADGEEFKAKDIIVATGSQPKCLRKEIPISVRTLDSSDILNLDHLPDSLCIIGAGVIGMEFASIFNAFGVKVYVVEYLKECLPTIDSDIAKRLRKTLERNGVVFHMQAAVMAVDENGVAFQDKKGKTTIIKTDEILMAVGRMPRTDGLGLENLDVKLENGAIPTEENSFRVVGPEGKTFQHLFAIGDVNGRMMLAHAAEMQAQRVVNLIVNKTDGIRFECMPAAVFTLPEAAAVGWSEDQCKEHGLEYTCHKAFWRANGKAMAMNETDGMLKLLANVDGTIIGCHAFGAHASDIVQEAAALICRDTTLQQLKDITHIHPTLSEILHQASESTPF